MSGLREFRAYELSAHDLADLIANQETAIITIGRSKVARLFILPLDRWRETIASVYAEYVGGDIERVSTRTTRGQLDEHLMMNILMNQVDTEWRPYRFAILTLDGADASYLVPANECWQKQVNNKETNDDTKS